jgi:hypothetical protein
MAAAPSISCQFWLGRIMPELLKGFHIRRGDDLPRGDDGLAGLVGFDDRLDGFPRD